MRKLLIALLKCIVFCCFLIALTLFSGIATIRYILATGSVNIPNIEGKDLEYARDLLAERHVQLRTVERQIDAELPKDSIIAQDPAPGTKVKKNQVVRVVVSGGVETIAIPDVIGKSWNQARRILRQNKFRIGNVAYAHSAEVPVDTIAAQTPLPHRETAQGTAVDLLISRGSYKNVMVMPDLVTEQLPYAIQVIERLGLVLNKVEHEVYPSVPPNTVLSHIPKPGTLVEERNMVTLVVSDSGGRAARSAGNTQQLYYQPLEYTVPPGPFEREVVVIVKNIEGITELYRGLIAPGFRIALQIPVVGPTAAEIYVDGTLDVVQRMNME